MGRERNHNREENSIQWKWAQLYDLDYADDFALLDHTRDQMQQKITELDEISRSVGLHIHTKKTEVLKVKSQSEEQVSLKESIEEVDTFCYLGSIIDGSYKEKNSVTK